MFEQENLTDSFDVLLNNECSFYLDNYVGNYPQTSDLPLSQPFDEQTQKINRKLDPITQWKLIDTAEKVKISAKNKNLKQQLCPIQTKESVHTKKKRSYFRRSKHPKEVVEAFLEQKKREKRERNRILAAESRKRQKAEMRMLKDDNERLKVELKNAFCRIKNLEKEVTTDSLKH